MWALTSGADALLRTERQRGGDESESGVRRSLASSIDGQVYESADPGWWVQEELSFSRTCLGGVGKDSRVK